MYVDHKHHLLGDEVAGIGFSYECLWRARLMLELAPSDTLSIYAGQDAKVEKADGRVIYYQIKHTSHWWTPDDLKAFTKTVENDLAAQPHVSYVFCSNAPLNPALKLWFKEIRERFGNRLEQRTWGSADKDKISAEIRRLVEEYYSPRKVTHVINFEHIDDCVNKLFTLEAEFKLSEDRSISGEQVWRAIGLRQLIESLPARITSDRLFAWSSWVDISRTQPDDPILCDTKKVALEHGSVERHFEKRVIEFAHQQLAQGANNLLLISGEAGTGKTWFLLRLGNYLSQHYPVYWADELATGSPPELATLASWEDRPTVILIDNLLEAEWGRFVPSGLRSQLPLLMIGTTARPPYDEEIFELKRRCGLRFTNWKMRSLLTRGPEGEIAALVDLLRKPQPDISRREIDKIKWMNIRGAARLLGGRRGTFDLVGKIISLWRRNDCQAWLTPLILCSSLVVKIPHSILQEYTRSHSQASLELPNDLWQLILRSKRQGDEILWMEDSDASWQALKNVRLKTEETSFDAAVLKETLKLLKYVNIQSAIHRRFMRLVIKRFCEAYPQIKERLLEESKELILQALPYESRWALAYVWLPFLPKLDRHTEAHRAAQEFISEIKNRGPKSVAEVIILIEAFGEWKAKEVLSEELKTAGKWGLEPWNLFIRELKALNKPSRKELLRLAMPILQIAPLDIAGLLESGNLFIDLLAVLKESGLAKDREWYLNLLHETLSNSFPHEAPVRQYLIPPYLSLVERCIMQRRSRLTISISRQLFDKSHQNDKALQELYGVTYDKYKRLYNREIENAYQERALSLGLNYTLAENKPTKATNLWQGLLEFTNFWAAPEERDQVEDGVYKFLSSNIENNIPSHLYENLVLRCARSLLNKSQITEYKLGIIYSLLKQTTNPQSLYQLLLLLVTATCLKDQSDSEAVGRAKMLLMSMVCEGGVQGMHRASEIFSGLAESLDVERPKTFDLPVMSEPKDLSYPIIIELLNCINHVHWEESELSLLTSTIYEQWKERPLYTLLLRLLITLLRLGASQQAKALLDTLITSYADTPDLLLLSCTWEARYGDFQLAQSQLVESQIKRHKGIFGAHPRQIARAFRALALRADSPKSEILKLCSALAYVGTLPPPEAVLQHT